MTENCVEVFEVDGIPVYAPADPQARIDAIVPVLATCGRRQAEGEHALEAEEGASGPA